MTWKLERKRKKRKRPPAALREKVTPLLTGKGMESSIAESVEILASKWHQESGISLATRGTQP